LCWHKQSGGNGNENENENNNNNNNKIIKIKNGININVSLNTHNMEKPSSRSKGLSTCLSCPSPCRGGCPSEPLPLQVCCKFIWGCETAA
jgi:hypothetical protein